MGARRHLVGGLRLRREGRTCICGLRCRTIPFGRSAVARSLGCDRAGRQVGRRNPGCRCRPPSRFEGRWRLCEQGTREFGPVLATRVTPPWTRFRPRRFIEIRAPTRQVSWRTRPESPAAGGCPEPPDRHARAPSGGRAIQLPEVGPSVSAYSPFLRRGCRMAAVRFGDGRDQAFVI